MGVARVPSLLRSQRVYLRRRTRVRGQKMTIALPSTFSRGRKGMAVSPICQRWLSLESLRLSPKTSRCPGGTTTFVPSAVSHCRGTGS